MIQNHYFQDMNDIVDSHCHLDFKDFDKDLELILKRAKEKVKYFLSISVNIEDFDKVYAVTKSAENIWCTTGVHPNNVLESKLDQAKLSEDLKNLKINKVIGLGETGLDFSGVTIIKKIKLNLLTLILNCLANLIIQQLFTQEMLTLRQ